MNENVSNSAWKKFLESIRNAFSIRWLNKTPRPNTSNYRFLTTEKSWQLLFTNLRNKNLCG